MVAQSQGICPARDKGDGMKSHTEELRQIANKLASGKGTPRTEPPHRYSQNWRGQLARRIRIIAKEMEDAQ